MPDALLTTVLVIVMVLGTVSISTLGWSIAGISRFVAGRVRPDHRPGPFTAAGVAVIIAAHNEELVIAETIRSASALVPADQIFVGSDGSSDRTAEVARSHGANVAEIFPNRGKAGAIAATIERFRLRDRFGVVLLLDADTRLRPDYLESGLPQFAPDDVVAVAGRATTVMDPRPATWLGRFLNDYRERMYVLTQYIQKYGQAATTANSVTIVPGFASMYRTDILDKVDIAAPGLSIEDFNMTFEVHAHKLGRIAFNPSRAIAETQDPTTLNEYARQVKRWSLGFWQTVRRHGWQPGLFWTALVVSILEVLVSSMVLLLAIPVLLASVVVWILALAGVGGPIADIANAFPPALVLIALWVPDLIMTVTAAVLSRRWPRPDALLFPVLRVVDATQTLRALLQMFRGTSDGRWKSPERRAFATAAASTSTVAVEQRDQAGARRDSHEAVDAGEAKLDGALGDEQFSSDLVVAQSPLDETNDITIPRAELLEQRQRRGAFG